MNSTCTPVQVLYYTILYINSNTKINSLIKQLSSNNTCNYIV